MRKSGILLHPSSLPGPYGIGDLGEDALRFADWLHATGQSLWQVLPLGPTGVSNSPYMCYSAFAGNPLLINPQELMRAGWLEPGALDGHARDTGRVAYAQVRTAKHTWLRKAFDGFRRRGGLRAPEFLAFRQHHHAWLDEYALFMALKSRFAGAPWRDWPADLAAADPDALAAARNELGDEIHFHAFVQFAFFQQWRRLRAHCAARGVELIGDLPLYVSYDSSDVWAHRELFQLDAQHRPSAVAGVPPDYFSASGQRWGNPLYRWRRMAELGFQWWIERLRLNFELVSHLRLDHFRGYEAYWEVPVDDLHTTRNGAWVQGPGEEFFRTVESALRRSDEMPRFIAEDLGVITPEVDDLRDRLGYPGMRILQMAFGTDPKAPEYRPHRHVRHCVVYTATHDHNTTRGWFTATPGSQTVQTDAEVAQERAYALAYLGTDGAEIHWDMIRLAMGSVADTAIVPLQDVLGLGSAARMNLPGTVTGNWEWRFSWGELEERHSERLSHLTRVFERTPGSVA